MESHLRNADWQSADDLLLAIFGVQLGFLETLNFLALPQEVFNQGARVMLVGTLALFVDVISIILIYELTWPFFSRMPMIRIFVTMLTVLTFDTVIFATGAFLERPNYGATLFSRIVGKVGIAVFYVIAMSIYLRFIEPVDTVNKADNRSKISSIGYSS